MAAKNGTRPKTKKWEGKTHKYRGNAEKCEVCGLSYGDFRTDEKLTFGRVRAMLWIGDPDYTKWNYKRRNTVLGLWHQIKKTEWMQHLELCLQAKEMLEKHEEELTELVEVLTKEGEEIPF